MKCPNCYNEIDRNLSECPYCGNINMVTFELPVLKDEDIKNYVSKKDLKPIPKIDDEEVEEKIPEIKEDFDEEPIPEIKEDTEKENIPEVEENPFKEEEEPIPEIKENPFLDDDAGITDEFDPETGLFKDGEDLSKFDEKEINVEDLFTDDTKEEPSINSDDDNVVVHLDEKDASESEGVTIGRKKGISICLFIAAMILVGALVYFMVFQKNTTVAYSDSIVEDNLSSYYSKQDEKYLDIILSSATDSGKISEGQTKTKEIILNWINTDINKAYESEQEFYDAANKISSLLSTINGYRLKNNGDSLINKEDYKELSNAIENLKVNNSRYFTASKLYNEKSYDDSYKELSRISSTNPYFDKSQALKRDIIEKILNLLRTDINKIYSDDMSEETRNEIKTLFTTYCEKYKNVPLNTNEDYIALQKQYN